MNPKTMKLIILALSRLGFDESKLSDAENEFEISEKDIISRVVDDETNIKPKVDEYIKKHDGVLVSKMNSQAVSLGIDKDKVEQAGGDIKKLFALVNDHLKSELGKSDDEKTKKLEDYQNQLRETQLAIEKVKQENATQLQEEKARFDQERIAQSRSFAMKNAMMKAGLSEDVVKNLDFYHQALHAKLSNDFDLKEQEGKLLAYKKGTEEKVFVDGSSNHADLDYLIEKTATDMKWKKVTDVAGAGDPNKGGSGTGGGAQRSEVFDRYAGSLTS